MVRLNVSGIQTNGRAKSIRRLSRRSGSEEINPSLAVLFGNLGIGCIHGFL
jgi:hypothetical protein